MAKKPWEKYKETQLAEKPWLRHEPRYSEVLEETPTRIESLIGGLGAGATLGFREELIGALGAGVTAATQPTKKQQKFLRQPARQSLKEAYKQARDVERKEQGELRAAHPFMYGAGEFTGAIPTTAVTPWLKPVKGAITLPKVLGAGARAGILGGIVAAGATEADLTEKEYKEFAKDIGKGAGLGAAFGMAVPTMTGIGRMAKRAVKRGVKGGVAGLLDVPMEAIEEKLKRPAAIRAAKTTTEIADELPDMLDVLDDVIKKADDKAWATLNRSIYLEEGAIPKADLLKVVSGISKKMGAAIGKQDVAAKRALSNLTRELQRQRPTISQGHLRDIIRKIDRNINWGDPTASTMNKKLINARVGFDNILKSKNTAYKKAMEPMGDMIRTRDDMLKRFSIKKTPTKGYEISDATVSKIKASHKEVKAATQKLFGDLRKYVNVPLKGNVKDAYIKSLFERADDIQAGKGIVKSIIHPFIKRGRVAESLIDYYRRNPLALRAVRSATQAPFRGARMGVRFGEVPTIMGLIRKKGE
jgi:hypothetical protein